MKRPPAPPQLTRLFREVGLNHYLHGRDDVPDQALRLDDGGPACWLFQHDEFERPCAGELEVIHLIGRQRIRNILHPQIAHLDFPYTFVAEEVEEILQTVEWDSRNAMPGCEGHYRRADNHMTPRMALPAAALPTRFIDSSSTAAWRPRPNGNLRTSSCRRRSPGPAVTAHSRRDPRLNRRSLPALLPPTWARATP